MGLPGKKPTANTSQLRNQNRQAADWTEVVNAPYVGEVPDLPSSRVVLTRAGQETVDMLDLTVEWWATISRMPHCTLWSDSDWLFAKTTAFVADAAFCGISSASTELRNREKVLGTTVEYRRDLRIRYVDPPQEKTENVSRIDDYRDLYGN